MKVLSNTKRSLLLAMLLNILACSAVHAQLNVQSNPVFSTPTPGEQKIGPMPKPFQATVEYKAGEAMSSDQEFSLGEIEYEGNHYYNDWTVKRYLKPILHKEDRLISEDELKSALAEINKTSRFKCGTDS